MRKAVSLTLAKEGRKQHVAFAFYLLIVNLLGFIPALTIYFLRETLSAYLSGEAIMVMVLMWVAMSCAISYEITKWKYQIKNKPS